MKRQNRLYLIRHGQIDGFENYPIYGHTDIEITETGKLQMQKVAERLSMTDIKVVYSSDLKRTKLGAHLIAGHHDIPIFSLAELREMHFGDWEGMTLEQIRELFPQELKKRQEDLINFKIPGRGESIAQFEHRVMAALDNIRSQHRGHDIALVVHGGVNRVILCNALGLDLRNMFRINQDYGCLNIIDYLPDTTVVRLMNG
jgi:alpha-ribazole phosphatase/probable phosphoglycerate mutase